MINGQITSAGFAISMGQRPQGGCKHPAMHKLYAIFLYLLYSLKVQSIYRPRASKVMMIEKCENKVPFESVSCL